MKNFLLIAFTAILMPVMAFAQFSISGKITESKSNSSLAGSSVSLTNGLSSAKTNTNGFYSLSNLKQGSYTISVSYLGYKTLTKEITLNSNTEINFELNPTSILSDEVIVKATRAESNSATTFRNINKAEIEKNNLGQDIPYLLNQTPSVVVSSDAGAGVGYTGIRIRGSDATRINVTLNGIPLNDAESQGSYFINLPDFASSIDNIQVQRGVGTSTNGAGAFGGSINIQTITRKDSAYAELNNTYGSYETWKNTVNVGTGLINGKFTFDGRLSRIKSDGYIDRASSNLKSFFVSGAYYGKKDLLRANVFSGTEKTFQAWNGIPEAKLTGNIEELTNHYNRNKGSVYFTVGDSINLFNSNKRKFNGFLYDNQTDNYQQDHYQLFYTHTFSDKLYANTALHYTYGRGYYEEFKVSRTLADYKIDPIVIGDSTITEANLVRRLWLDNDFYGLTYSINYNPETNLNFTLGGGYNEYDGKHFDEVVWSQFANYNGSSSMRHRYNEDNAFKTDFNIFSKATYKFNKLNLFADLQYRRISYSFFGIDNKKNNIQQEAKLNFFNPKVGFTYFINQNNNVYASFAIGNKEPNRNDFVNSTPDSRPKAENLKNIEAGYRTNSTKFNAGINGFAMFYKDQLILTGEINDVGSYTRQNVPVSYRAGVEFDGNWQITNKLSWGATASLSENKIKQFSEFIDDYDNGGQQLNVFDNTDIAFSPSFITSSELSFQPVRKTEIAFLSKYVGKQYLDNTSNNERDIDAFFVNDLRLRYNISFKQVKNIALTLLVNNVFSELYEANGYTFSYIAGGSQTENYYYPQATRNFLLSLNLKF